MMPTMQKKVLVAFIVTSSLALALPARAQDARFEDEGWLIHQREKWFFETRGLLDPGADLARAARLRLQAANQTIERARLMRQNRQNRMAANPWTSIGPAPTTGGFTYGNTTGRTNDMAFEPGNPNTFYVAASSGGLWKTTNGGTTYTCLTNDLPSQSTSAIVVRPSNPSELWLGTGDVDGSSGVVYWGSGIYRSTDGGATWQARNGSGASSLPVGSISAISLDPANAQGILVGMNARQSGNVGLQGGIFRTTDAGGTWTEIVPPGITNGIVIWNILRDPGTPSIVYAGRRGSSTPERGVYKSTDNGLTFVDSATGMSPNGTLTALVMAPSNSQILYYLDGGSRALFKSTNGAATWTSVNGNVCQGGQCWYDLAIQVSLNDPNVIYTGDLRPWKSTNGGTTFTALSTYSGKIHPDIQHIAIHPTDPNTIFFGCDGGLWKTADGGGVFTNLNGNMAITQFYDIGISGTTDAPILGGSQDNGEHRYMGTLDWPAIAWPGGDGMMVAINPQNGNYCYTEIYPNPYASIYRSTTGVTGVFSKVSSAINEGSAWVTPYVLDPTTPSKIYVGTRRVWRSTDNGTSWAVLMPSQLSNYFLACIAVSKSNGNYIYVGSRGGVWRTTDGGTTWGNVTGNLALTAAVYDIAVDPSNPDHVAIAVPTFPSVGQTIANNFWTSTTGGTTWTSVQNGLPQVPASAVLMVPNPYRIYVGTDAGVFVATSDAGPYVPDMNGFPEGMPVIELEYNSTTNTITAGTYGRSAWQQQAGTVETWNVTVGKGANSGALYDSQVNAYRVDGTKITQIDTVTYATGTYGVNTAGGELTGDGVGEIITGQGPGSANPPTGKVFNNAGAPLASWAAYGGTGYGLNVASGDLDGDVYEEILTGPGEGSVYGPQVRGWNYDNSGSVTPINKINYYAYSTPRYGVNVGGGNFDADGYDEILTGAGPGAVFGPHVRGFNYDNSSITSIAKINFFAYSTLKYGVNVSAGDIDNDGYDEILTGPGPSGAFGATVRGFNVDGGTATSINKINYDAYTFKYGVNVASDDLDGDGYAEIATGPGPGPASTTNLKGWNYDNSSIVEIAAMNVTAYSGLSYGLTVGTGSYGY